ncbi:glycosyltransferase family 4 protein [Sediminibacterium ginsengisoli]|uniref:Glycosyltransferase involved in cell wall bisynthesis n=1 Tax=Sediminibacterium ginsengisoli TaxID=413434 RepID=A0A1T4Q4T0_9BACT|nr:glycosyltransferase family 4 protein [Sediminibacterium ginsengisoli]SJZ98773.1 Glycosyltransferase involved in cell wall bisynthesis [Sediminibacterium ginsengisoli]
MIPVVFLNSHPIQYFVPLYQKITAENSSDLEIIYCSGANPDGKLDKEFGKKIQWDIPMLTGYRSRFLKNHSFKPSSDNGFFGLINFGILKYLFKKEKSVFIIHGWGYATNIMAILFAKTAGHVVCLRAETPYVHELKKNRVVTFFKHLWLRMLFSRVDRFLYIGNENKRFYTALGVSEKQLVFAPYCIDNKRFAEVADAVSKEEARALVKLPGSEKIILYSGKYISKKRPLDLLQAMLLLKGMNIHLVMVGEGDKRAEMETFINDNELANDITLTGFVNQSQIPYYYAAADIFVMTSGLGETWGLSVNEAMNFGLPVILSDMTGSAFDLVRTGYKNGEIYKTGDIVALANGIRKYLSRSTEEVEAQRNATRQLIRDEYSYEKVIQAIEKIKEQAGK